MPDGTKFLEVSGKTPDVPSLSTTPAPAASGLAAFQGAAGNMAIQRAARLSRWTNSDGIFRLIAPELVRRALSGEADFVQEILDDVGSDLADNLSDEIVNAALDDDLDAIHRTRSGRMLLNRMFDDLTSGNVSQDEATQADRILQSKSRRMGPEEFGIRAEHAKIFPYRPGGFTVLDDSPIMAELRPHAKVWVKLPVRVLHTDMFREEVRTLPWDTFIGGIELQTNEVIGVKRYDLGGQVEYRPALYLVQMARAADENVFSHIRQTAMFVATLGTGALAARGAGWAARALLFADRAATAIGAVSTIINEHRGDIIERFGESGRTFLGWVDRVNSVVAVYGGIRAVMGTVQLLNQMRNAYQNWQNYRRMLSLSEEEAKLANQLERETESFFRSVDEARVANDNASVDFTRPPVNDPAVAASPTSGSGATAPAPSAPVSGGGSYSPSGPYTGGGAAPKLYPSYAPPAGAQPRLWSVPATPAPLPATPAPAVPTPTPVPSRPAPQPVPAPVEPPIQSSTSLGFPPLISGARAPGNQPAPWPDPDERRRRRRPPIILYLPMAKGADIDFYAVHLGSLQHRLRRPRDTNQLYRWLSEVPFRIPQPVWMRARSLGIAPYHRVIPYWSRSQVYRTEMQVDHIIEMQVTPIGNEGFFDDMWNLRLMDAFNNASVGSQLAWNIEFMRNALRDATGNQGWMYQDITFENIAVRGELAPGLWTLRELIAGEHIEAFIRLGRPAPP